MDFSFSEEQDAVRELAGRIFTDLSTQERLRAIETSGEPDRFDAKLWAELASAGLLGISLPESVGGAGLGFLETGLVVEAAGRTAAYVPAVETLAAAAPAIAAFGTEAQCQQWLPGVVAGERINRVIAAKAEAVGISFEAQKEISLSRVSLRRMTDPQEIANMALFLCSEAGSVITGQALSVCGNVEALG